MRRIAPLVAWIALLPGCAADEAEDGADDDFLSADGKEDSFGIAEGSAEAVAILAVANDLSTADLRGEVGLSSRTSREIEKYRVGADSKAGTSDDRDIDTLRTLDGISYVGPIAFEKLLDYVRDQGLVSATPMAAEARRTPWSGYYWSMLNGELVLGWNDGDGRVAISEADARAFDACLASNTTTCRATLARIAGTRGEKLSPLFKFDYYVRLKLEAQYGAGGAPASAYTHAGLWELEHHYIGDNTEHRYWDSRGYAGKCIGWALSTRDFDEPTRDVVIGGVRFRPADIKGYLASIYNGAQFFIPEEMAIGHEFHDREGANSSAYYNDVRPDDFVRGLFATIGKGEILEADLEPGDGVWNYPIHKYQLTVVRKAGTKRTVRATLWYADDEVDIDLVSTADPDRPDLKSRDLEFELTLPSGSDDLAKATDGQWLGGSVDTHPDVLLLGVEEDWRRSIYDYRNTDMNTEVNFALIKRVSSSGGWVPMVDQLLNDYYD